MELAWDFFRRRFQFFFFFASEKRTNLSYISQPSVVMFELVPEHKKLTAMKNNRFGEKKIIPYRMCIEAIGQQ